jgi:hypothetical protein
MDQEKIYEMLESCKSLKEARELASKVKKLASKYDANFYFVTDGASCTSNKGNEAVKVARDAVAKWEKDHGFDDKEDWSKNPDDFSNYRLKKESENLGGLEMSYLYDDDYDLYEEDVKKTIGQTYVKGKETVSKVKSNVKDGYENVKNSPAGVVVKPIASAGKGISRAQMGARYGVGKVAATVATPIVKAQVEKDVKSGKILEDDKYEELKKKLQIVADSAFIAATAFEQFLIPGPLNPILYTMDAIARSYIKSPEEKDKNMKNCVTAYFALFATIKKALEKIKKTKELPSQEQRMTWIQKLDKTLMTWANRGNDKPVQFKPMKGPEYKKATFKKSAPEEVKEAAMVEVYESGYISKEEKLYLLESLR